MSARNIFLQLADMQNITTFKAKWGSGDKAIVHPGIWNLNGNSISSTFKYGQTQFSSFSTA